MEVRTGHVADIPARLLRVGFVGELGYEIHVPSSQGEALWDSLTQAGAHLGILPFGVEAQRLLRLEKGHIIVGQDTDGLTIPHEANMAWAIAKNKSFFIGKRAIEIMSSSGIKRELVGFTLNSRDSLPDECNLVLLHNEITGRVTSVAFSPSLNKTIGLAYVAPEQSPEGTQLDIKKSDGSLVQARVASLPFYDPEKSTSGALTHKN